MRSPGSPTRCATRSRSSSSPGRCRPTSSATTPSRNATRSASPGPCTKHNYLVKSIADLPRVLHEAFHIAKSGRPGPVVVDIPKDIQFAKGVYSRPKDFQHKGYQPKLKGDLDRIKAAIELMQHAKRPLFYTGGGVINSGPEASQLLRELVQAHRLSHHLDADGARRLSRLRSAMARHARHARHLGGQPGDARLRPDDLHRRALRRPHHRPARRLLARLEEDPRRHRSVLDQQERQGRHSDHRRLRPRARGHGAAVARQRSVQPDKKALDAWWKQIEKWRARKSLAYRNSNEIIKPQYAIERLYELTKDRDTYITTEVGQHQMWAAQFYQFEEPNRWMTSGGLGTMGYGLPAVGRRAARASEFAGHRHRRRSLGADDHAGDVDGGAVRAADQDLHHQQPVHGHGAPVAGAAARRALRAFLHRGLARLREARRGLSRGRHPLREAGRSRRRDPRDDRR